MLKNFMYKALAEATTEMYFASQTKKGKAAIGALACAGTVLGLTDPLYAKPLGGLNEKVGNLLRDVYGLIAGAATGIAVVMLSIALVQYIIADDPSDAKRAKDRAKRIIIGWFLIMSVATIAAAIDSVKGGTYNGSWS